MKKNFVIISALILVILIIIHEIFYYSISHKLIENLGIMNVSSTVIALSTSKIWSDAINKKVSSVSKEYFEQYDVYGVPRYKYDFNVGIENFYLDNDTKAVLKLIDSTSEKCSKYYQMYGYTLFHNKRNRIIEDFYDASLRLKKLAEYPSGNYTTFTRALNEQLDAISVAKTKLHID